jgi:hypothetical protein
MEGRVIIDLTFPALQFAPFLSSVLTGASESQVSKKKTIFFLMHDSALQLSEQPLAFASRVISV